MTSLENHRGKHRQLFKVIDSIFMELGNIENPLSLNWTEVLLKWLSSAELFRRQDGNENNGRAQKVQQQQVSEIISRCIFPEREGLPLPEWDLLWTRLSLDRFQVLGKSQRERCPGVSRVANIRSSAKTHPLKMKGSPSQVGTALGEAIRRGQKSQ